MPHAKPELYDVEIDGRSNVNDAPLSGIGENLDRHGPGSVLLFVQPRNVVGENGRADHGSVASSPRVASARAYTSHSLPTQVSFQFVPCAVAKTGTIRNTIDNVFIELSFGDTEEDSHDA